MIRTEGMEKLTLQTFLLLKEYCEFLLYIADNQTQNKMTIRNVSIVASSTIMTNNLMETNTMFPFPIVEFILCNYDKIFQHGTFQLDANNQILIKNRGSMP